MEHYSLRLDLKGLKRRIYVKILHICLLEITEQFLTITTTLGKHYRIYMIRGFIRGEIHLIQKSLYAYLYLHGKKEIIQYGQYIGQNDISKRFSNGDHMYHMFFFLFMSGVSRNSEFSFLLEKLIFTN